MQRKRTSIVWQESREEFIERIKQCQTIAGILKSYNQAISGASYKTVNHRIDAENLGHLIQRGLGANKGRKFPNTAQPIEVYLVQGRDVSTSSLRKRLIKEGLLENKCVICGNIGIWLGEPLSLQLDHKNGIRNDNRLENLRILCPNCHTQTETHSGKDRSTKCLDCGVKTSGPKYKRCRKCGTSPQNLPHPTKFEITKEELEKLVWEKPTRQIAADLGVSDKAVEKRCKKFGISKPPRGYWQKQKLPIG